MKTKDGVDSFSALLHHPLVSLVEYTRRNRQVGHTTLMLDGVRPTCALPSIVVAADSNHADILRREIAPGQGTGKQVVIPWRSLSRSLYGVKYPLVIDHFALEDMVFDFLDKAAKKDNTPPHG